MQALCGFVHPASRPKVSSLDKDRPGKVRKGPSSTQFSPHTDPHDTAVVTCLENAAPAHRDPRRLG